MSVGCHDLDEDVELAGADDHVVGLGPARDLVRDLARRARGLHADECLVEAEPERVRDRDDLQDPLAGKPGVARADRRLRDAEVRGDPPERLAAVRLERLDDPPVELVDPARRGDRPTAGIGGGDSQGLGLGAAQRVGLLPLRCALRQLT